MRKLVAFLSGMLNGAIVGAVTALMLTPQSGKELREQARRRYNDMLEEGRKAADARRAEVLAEFEEMKRS